MSKRFLVLFMLCSLCFSGLRLTAQTTSLPGKVTDETGAPLPNASINFKGREGGVVSKDNGEFTISTTGKGILVVSAVGYATQEINISGLKRVDVALKKTTGSFGSCMLLSAAWSA